MPRTPRRVAGFVIGAVGALAFVGAAAVAAVTVVFARRVVIPPRQRQEDVEIVSVDRDAGIIVLASHPESLMSGRYSFWFDSDAGHARLGDILASDEDTVTRSLLSVDFGDLAGAERGRFSGYLYLGPWEFGLPYDDVSIETELGPAPAWLVPAEVDDAPWAILVHGRAVQRHEGLRAVRAVHDAGYTALLISYRNDGEAPESGDGRYGLGDTEWVDVDAAIRFARSRGARDVVLLGWSMGGAIALQTLLRSPEADIVRGVVLDSPAIDWLDILAFQGELVGLPAGLSVTVAGTLSAHRLAALAGLDEPIGFTRLDVVKAAGSFTVPIHVLHSVDDGYVPITGSRRLAEARPDIVTLDEWTGALHTKLWNDDAERWEQGVAAVLTRLRDAP
ncbi:alpha/beta hydrolase [Agromyces atrinae]|uniref:alpha/beta hydrolase family protein n=1 Tax=Agromyces atrinae TaxID=592376 RepID=UPI001F585ED6|nr:alpha/beta fold hydrolase [Agromyces atrinae]MCI2958914.1 alpha/beta hydrolase [Agromyces atrinae]